MIETEIKNQAKENHVSPNNHKPDFRSTETAFARKNDKDLMRTYKFFRLMNHRWLTNPGTFAVNLSLKIGLPIQSLLRKTIFHHFAGGENLEDTKGVIERLAKDNIMTALGYSVESEMTEEAFERTAQENIRACQTFKNTSSVKFIALKVTGIGSKMLLEKVQRNETLTDEEKNQFLRLKSRVDKICRAAFENGVSLFIDAEETWIQDVIDELAMEMMKKYNKEKPVVYITYQMYRHDRLNRIKQDYALAEKENFILAAKIVRGAYLEKENDTAKNKNYRTPIHYSKKDTDHDYDAAIDLFVQHIECTAVGIGTHNEESVMKLIQCMREKNIPNNHPRIYFSQLYGMGDNITYNLARHGYNAVKYLPYGPLCSVLPYLFRRAKENSSVANQASRELEWLKTEMRRRKLL